MEPLAVIERFGEHDFSVHDFFTRRALALGDKAMIEFEGEAMPWSACLDLRERARTWLKAQGVEFGDRVGLMSYNHPSTVVLFLAACDLGVILVPCNPEFSASEAQYIFEHAQVCAVICSGQVKDKVLLAVSHMGPTPWIVVNDAAEPSLIDTWLGVSPDPFTIKSNADTTCLIIYTSGTTGFPKGVMHSQRSYLLTAEAFVHRLYLQADERMMCVLPLFHINALMYSLGGAMACGGTLILVRKFSASEFWLVALKTRATQVNVIMSAAAILSRRPMSEFQAGHQIHKMFLAPLNQDLLDIFHTRFLVPTLIECYGMTEIPGVLSNPFLGPHKLGSMGRISPHPSPKIQTPQVRVLDDSGLELPMGEVGEIAVKTPTIMQGYYKDEAQTAASFKEGWFLTGDLGYRDADDFFFFFTRKKDIIRRKGENLSGAEIDTAISSHPDVQECASIGVAAELGEEEVLIAIVPKPGSTLTPEAVYEHAKKVLSPLKWPRFVVLVESLPHTGSMKIAKFKLKPAQQLLELATDFQA
jgi:crotonobetaine/carnitine-CoA ligase